MEKNDTFQIEQLDEVAVLTPLIDLRELEYERIERDGAAVLEHLASKRVQHLIVDFAHTDYYGSTALGFFVRLWKAVRQHGGNMAFCNVSPHERETLHLTRLDTLWFACGTRDEAMQRVRGC